MHMDAYSDGIDWDDEQQVMAQHDAMALIRAEMVKADASRLERARARAREIMQMEMAQQEALRRVAGGEDAEEAE